MTKTVLLKIPGVKPETFERLLNFINSDENRPIDNLIPEAGGTGRSFSLRYVVLLSAEMEKEGSNSCSQLSLKILMEYGARNNAGGITLQTPRKVIEDILERLEIFS